MQRGASSSGGPAHAVLSAFLVIAVAGCGRYSTGARCGNTGPLDEGTEVAVVVRFNGDGTIQPVYVNRGLYGPPLEEVGVARITPSPSSGTSPAALMTRHGRVANQGGRLQLLVAEQTVNLVRYRCN